MKPPFFAWKGFFGYKCSNSETFCYFRLLRIQAFFQVGFIFLIYWYISLQELTWWSLEILYWVTIFRQKAKHSFFIETLLPGCWPWGQSCQWRNLWPAPLRGWYRAAPVYKPKQNSQNETFRSLLWCQAFKSLIVFDNLKDISYHYGKFRWWWANYDGLNWLVSFFSWLVPDDAPVGMV